MVEHQNFEQFNNRDCSHSKESCRKVQVLVFFPFKYNTRGFKGAPTLLFLRIHYYESNRFLSVIWVNNDSIKELALIQNFAHWIMDIEFSRWIIADSSSASINKYTLIFVRKRLVPRAMELVGQFPAQNLEEIWISKMCSINWQARWSHLS